MRKVTVEVAAGVARVLGGGSGWAWLGFFFTEATLSSELIHMEKGQGGSYVLILAPHSTGYKVLPIAVGSKQVGTVIPILQKGENEAHGGKLIES